MWKEPEFTRNMLESIATVASPATQVLSLRHLGRGVPHGNRRRFGSSQGSRDRVLGA
jgi:hypothetical protein